MVEKSTPPQNLKELIDLYSRICNGEHSARLNERSINVLRKMLDAPNETAAKSISELAEEHGLHISSVTRLAQKLGFHGFHDLKGIFRNNLKKQRSYYSEQAKELLRQDKSKSQDNVSIFNHVVENEWSNVLAMLDQVDEQRIATIIDLLKDADHVMVLGLRGSYPIAYHLSFYLRMVLGRVTLGGQPGHTLGEDLSQLSNDSVLIAIGVTPYTKDTVDACRICLENDINLIAITDSISSPLVRGTEHFLISPIHGNFFFSPITAMVICVEALLSELVIQLGEKAIFSLNRTESFLESLQSET